MTSATSEPKGDDSGPRKNIQWFRYRVSGEDQSFRLHFPSTHDARAFLLEVSARFVPRRHKIAYSIAKIIEALLVLRSLVAFAQGRFIMGTLLVGATYLLRRFLIRVYQLYAFWIVMVDRAVFERARDHGWCHIETQEPPAG